MAKQSQSKLNEATYTIDEIVSSRRIPYAPSFVRIALQNEGKKEYSLEDAKAVCDDFANTEVL